MPSQITSVKRCQGKVTEVIVTIGQATTTFLSPTAKNGPRVPNEVYRQVCTIFGETRPIKAAKRLRSVSLEESIHSRICLLKKEKPRYSWTEAMLEIFRAHREPIMLEQYSQADQRPLLLLKSANVTVFSDGWLNILRWNQPKQTWDDQYVPGINTAIRMQEHIIERYAETGRECPRSIQRRSLALRSEKQRLDSIVGYVRGCIRICSRIKPPYNQAEVFKIFEDIEQARRSLATAWIMPYSAQAIQARHALELAEKSLGQKPEQAHFLLKDALAILDTDLSNLG